MFEGRRALYLQLALFEIAIGLLLVFSCFFPLVDLVDAAQHRVKHWGAWSGVCYPLLFAFCNVLLLPGGLLSVGGGLFLYVYLGTLGQFGLNLARGRSHPRLVEYWTWGGAFVAAALLFILLTRIALRAIQGSQELSQLEKPAHRSNQMSFR